MTFYNTTKLKGEGLSGATEMAGTQEDIVLRFFLETKRDWTPHEVHQRCSELFGAPITSVRRALTDLTSAGKLEKTEIQREGGYGALSYAWRLVDNPLVEKSGQMRLW